ncbi:MAG TPA: Hsp20/alpha crystallin family protein [Methanobacterium sp.]|jgi:HSP20 family protein|nr:Hsp20/alpha crystallin family protein [Methanobacterium sp.]
MNDRKNRAEQIFNEMIKTIKERQVDLDQAIAEYTSGPVKPAMDVAEDNEQITVTTELPGVERENIKIDLSEESLEIRAEFKKETEEEGEESGVTYHRKERRHGTASRVVVLPAKVKIDEVTARFENGVLTIIMPKLDKRETYEVKVE